MVLNKNNIVLIGTLACIGAFIGVVADLFSGWANTPNLMNAAISIDIESIKGLYSKKPRWTFVLGNYLGVFSIPFHMLGFLLIYIAVRPAGKLKALIFISCSFYLVALGSGFHGTFAFIGDTIQSGDTVLLMKMTPYWYNWGLVLVIGYIAISSYLFFLIISGTTMYQRSAVLLSPLSLLIVNTVIIALMPEGFHGIKALLAVTGLNLPLLVFYIMTIKTLLRKSSITNVSS
jgi:hypothetical protein